MSSIIRNTPYTNLNNLDSDSPTVGVVENGPNNEKKSKPNDKNQTALFNDENMAPEYTNHEENSNSMKVVSLKRSNSFLKRLGFKQSSKTNATIESASTSFPIFSSSSSSDSKDVPSSSFEINRYSSPSKNKGPKKNKFRIQCFGGGKPDDMIMSSPSLSSSVSSDITNASVSSSVSSFSPNRKMSKIKKKKRKSLKITEPRNQSLEDQEGSHNNEKQSDQPYESSTEGTVQKKLKEMNINTSEAKDDKSLPVDPNQSEDGDDDRETNQTFLKVSNIYTNTNSMHNGAEEDSSMVSSLDLSTCPTSPLVADEDPLDSLDHHDSMNYYRNASLLDSDEEYDDHSDEYSDEDYDDDESCDSTVINSSRPPIVMMKPPLTATKEEQTRFYWELCYGKQNPNNIITYTHNQGWSINRAPPIKSCLSTKKTCWSTISKQKRSRIIHNQHQQSTPTLCDRFDFNKNNDTKSTKDNNSSSMMVKDPSPLMIAKNPKDTAPSVDHLITPYHNRNNNTSICSTRSLTFGPPSAAEFDKTRPTGELTPLPNEVARMCFPVDPIRHEESEEESEEEHNETARNGATLAAWEDDFDSFLADEESDDDSDSQMNEASSRRRRRSSSNNLNSQRNRRRSSSFFSKSGKPLVESDSNDSISTTDFFKSEDFFSPPSSSTSNNSSSTNQETPDSERTMSSALLRRVHSSGGASLGHPHDDIHDYPQQHIQPNQLDSKLQSTEMEPESQMGAECHHENILDRLLLDPKSPVDWSMSNFMHELIQYPTDRIRNREIVKQLKIPKVDSSWLLECISCMNKELDFYSDDIVETMKMVVSSLEQQSELNHNKQMHKLDQSRNDLNMEEKLLNSPDNLLILYSSMCNSVQQDWRQLEIETLSTAFEWLSPLTIAGQEMSNTLNQSLDLLHTVNLSRNNSKLYTINPSSIQRDMDSITILEKKIEEETKKLKFEQAQQNLWNNRLELELSAPISVVKSLLFCNIVSFEACTLQHDAIDLAFPHLDGSRTMLSWSATTAVLNSNSDSGTNDSISINDSSSSNFGDMIVTNQEPLIKRIYDSPFGETNQIKPLQDGIPYPRPQTTYLHKEKDKLLRDMYNTLLQDVPIASFIKDMWEYNASFGIAISMDIWSRLDLMTLDVAALKRYYKCNFKKNALTKRDEVVVRINYGMDKKIGIRFTYDFANDPKCALYILPSSLYVYAIQGEPAVPIQVLQQFGEEKMRRHNGCNAFILKQICSGVIDKLTTYFKF